jgi:ATP-dependent Lon protease
MHRHELPLIGLLEETLLPGEERAFRSPVVDAASLTALARGAPAALCALTVTSAIELPSLVSNRWGTSCEIVSVDDERVTLRGLRRVKVLSARGARPPYTADVESPDEGETLPLDGRVSRDVLSGGHALLAALEAGGVAPSGDGDRRVFSALADLLRAVASPEDLRDQGQGDLGESLRNVARAITGQAPHQRASCELEAMTRETARKDDVPLALKHRLWSQVVEIQRRLDVYDPTIGTGEGDEIGKLQRRLMQAGLPRAARDVARRELRLLRNMNSSHHDYATYLSHLDLMARLPWQPDAVAPLDLDAVRAELDREHSGLEKPKRRVLEYLAVRALGGDTASTVLCLAGPPGVGKTTIAQAIAKSLGRKFVRVALGGVHDESELRGHRMSYTAASAGRILSGVAQAGSASAVVLLDEIDKVGTDRQRSPTGALLEVLDPAQNTHFHDNFLGVAYDLSGLFFICTANDLSAMHPTLRDRMELVEIEGYTVREKVEIARRNMLVRAHARAGLPRGITLDDETLVHIIESHTREAGVRQLERALGAIHRARALSLVERRAREGATDEAVLAPPVTAEEVRAALGPGRGAARAQPDALPMGASTGLSVSAEGGSTLLIEVGRLPGRNRLRFTGRLGNVMQESAETVLAHLRLGPERYGVARAALEGEFHVHVPEAATPKDGPSAGVALFVAMLSVAMGAAARADVAFTGEVTLNGSVLPVGGVRAKLLAAERAGITRVVIPVENKPDVPDDVRIEVIAVERLADVVPIAFGDPRAPKATATKGGRHGKAST